MRIWIAAAAAAAVVAALILGGGLFVQKAQAKAAEASGITAEDPQEALGGPETAVPGDELHMMDDSNLGASHLRIVLFTSPKASDDHAVNESVRSGLAEFMESDNTVMVHIRKVREKIEENPRKPKFIKTVWGVGYKIDR